MDKITNALASIDFQSTPKLCREAVESGISAREVLDSLSRGMDIIGKKFEDGEYFLSELIMAGEMFKEAQEIVAPYIKEGQFKVLGKVVIGTVEGDLHDIGKNIVIVLLRAEGFEVLDLGINAPASRFVDAVRKERPDVLGISALLRVTMGQMEVVLRELEKAKLRDKVKVIVGGLPLTAEYAKRIGADYYAKDAPSGVEIIKQVVEAK